MPNIFKKILFWSIQVRRAQYQSNLRFSKFYQKLTLNITFYNVTVAWSLKIDSKGFFVTLKAVISLFKVFGPKGAQTGSKELQQYKCFKLAAVIFFGKVLYLLSFLGKDQKRVF